MSFFPVQFPIRLAFVSLAFALVLELLDSFYKLPSIEPHYLPIWPRDFCAHLPPEKRTFPGLQPLPHLIPLGTPGLQASAIAYALSG